MWVANYNFLLGNRRLSRLATHERLPYARSVIRNSPCTPLQSHEDSTVGEAMRKPRWRRLSRHRVATAALLAWWCWASGCAAFDTDPPPEGPRRKLASDVLRPSVALTVHGRIIEVPIIFRQFIRDIAHPLPEYLKAASEKAVRESGNFSSVEPEGTKVDLRIDVLIERRQAMMEGGLRWMLGYCLIPCSMEFQVDVTTTVSRTSDARKSTWTANHTYMVWYHWFQLFSHPGPSMSKHREVIHNLTQTSVSKALDGLEGTGSPSHPPPS